MKKLNPVLRSVIVLSCIMLVCSAVLVIANKFLGLSDEERLGRTLNSLIKNEGAQIVYDKLDAEIVEFNEVVPARERIFGKVLRVYRLNEGVNGGKYVIEAEGEGYQSNSVSLIAFNLSGTVYGVAVKQFGAAENLAYRVNQSLLSELAASASLENEQVGELIKYDQLVGATSATGAVATLNGILSSINISSIFYKEVILGIVPDIKEEIEIVTSQEVIDDLAALLALDGQSSATFYKLNSVKTDMIPLENVGAYDENNQAQVVCAYMGDGGQFILQIYGRGYSDGKGDYGIWEIYTLMNSQNLIQSVRMISNSARPRGNFSYLEQLLNDLFLTNQLKNKQATYFASDNGLPFDVEDATASATQTNNGIKVCAYLAVTKSSELRTLADQIISSNGLPNGGAL